MKRLVILILLVGALIIPVTDVSAQKALPQNIYCIMTVDDTISCHETEAACKIVEQQQISGIEQPLSIPINFCNNFSSDDRGSGSNIPRQDTEQSADNIDTQQNDAVPDQSSSLDDSDLCANGCINEGTAESGDAGHNPSAEGGDSNDSNNDNQQDESNNEQSNENEGESSED